MDQVIKVVKAIHIDGEALKEIDNTFRILDSIVDELHEIIQEDDFYQILYDEAKHAWGALGDFLDAYAERDK